MRDGSADQKATTACFDLGIAGLQVGFVLEHLFDVQANAVLGLLPTDIALGKLRTGGCPHGPLQDLLELRLTRLLLRNALANSLEFPVGGGQLRVLAEVQGLTVVLGVEAA